MKVFKIDDIPEFSKKERIVVVGVIGKSPYRYPNKATPLVSSVQTNEKGIECHWDEGRGILYLHAITDMDAKQLVTLAESLDENSKSTQKDADAADWLVASGELAMEACRVIALLFNLCHIVVLSSPTPVFDIGYLQLFKAIDAYRQELTPQVTAAADAGAAWLAHGRWCCPRLLFHFQRAPAPLRRNTAGLKRLEHAVEDQLYFILRKARIITNICAKSLFAIPKNEEFVYMSTCLPSSARDVSSLVRGLVQMCAGAGDDVIAERQTFGQFVMGHVELAFKEGFDDNVVKYGTNAAFFELPSASTWRAAAQAISDIYLQTPQSEDQSPGGALYDALATDVRFSEARCAKVLPIAQASYAEGLPSHYSSQHHAHKLVSSLRLLSSMARGPVAAAAARRLRASTAAVWRARTLCELPSLTRHKCQHPDHDSTKEHSSGVRYISACNCGRTRCSRADPYTVQQANHSFYEQAAAECGVCPTLQAVHFPVFEPSTTTFKEASLPGSQEEAENLSGEWSQDALSAPAHDHSAPRYEIVPVAAGKEDKPPLASTTEYLPGMLHVSSPPALLPRFPSWALVCAGASSLYSHSAGLPDSLQPGFLPHTNFLLPWDCSVKQEGVWGWRGSAGRGRKPHHLTVKIFFGYEYECPRGHRFIYQSCVSGAGAVVASSSVPVYASCGCRASTPATLAKLHVVTPKANVHVTLNPQVQPVPGGPIFVPQPAGAPPIKLSPSAYWVLRFPFMYASERGVLPRPPTCPPHPAGMVHPHMFGLEE